MNRPELVRSVYTVTERPLHVVGDGEQKPVAKSIWYVLATIAGEPGKTPNPVDTIARNRFFWNSFMTARLDPLNPAITDLKPGLHLPGWLPETRQTIREVLNARGFRGVRIPDANDPIDFSYVDFHDPIWFDGFVFGGPTTFKGARFGGHSHSFEGAVFTHAVIFEDAEFSGVFFGPDIVFAGSACFDGAKFHSGASYIRCEFRAQAEFDEAQFLEDATFDHCKFTGRAGFAGAVFGEMVDFRSAEFLTSALFQEADFKSYVPFFFGARLPEYTEWHNTKWPRVPQEPDDALDQIQRYQRLALLMNGIEKFDDQRMFVRQEMHARRRIERWTVAGRIKLWNVAFVMNWLYDFICGYGYGLTQVVVVWLLHMMLGAVALCGSKIGTLKGEGTLWQATRESFADFHVAFALSFGNAHGPLGLNRTFLEDALQDWPWYGVVGPVQTVLGVIILFFLLLTIRNRFRMR